VALTSLPLVPHAHCALIHHRAFVQASALAWNAFSFLFHC
jgi:hypothetical protein